MEPMVGQIELFAFSFAPVGFLPCNGQLMAIDENTVLYSLIGTTYGGDGKTTFALPTLAPVTHRRGQAITSRSSASRRRRSDPTARGAITTGASG